MRGGGQSTSYHAFAGRPSASHSHIPRQAFISEVSKKCEDDTVRFKQSSHDLAQRNSPSVNHFNGRLKPSRKGSVGTEDQTVMGTKRAASTVQLPAPISVAPSGEFSGNDGSWSTFSIKIGTPPQLVKVLISTVGSQTWAVAPEGCTQNDLANCSVSRGGIFQPNSSSTWVRNQDTANGLYPLTLETNLNRTGNGLYGTDTISLDGKDTNGPTLTQQAIVAIAAKDYYLGLFGLNPHAVPMLESTTTLPTYLGSLNDSGLIPSLSWGYTAGNPYRPGPRYGSLTLGGYDRSRFVPNNVSFAFNGTDTRSFTVNIWAMVLTIGDSETVLETPNKSLLAAVDSTIPDMVLPEYICQRFETAFGITWNAAVQGYTINDTQHDALSSQNTSVVLTLGNSPNISDQGFNISLPYAAFDLIAGPPLLNSPSRYFPLKRAANASQVTLGRVVLQEMYVIADYERNNFSISQCDWDTTSQPKIVAIKRPNDIPKPHHLSKGAVAGIAIGGIIAFIVIIAVIVVMYLRRRRRLSSERSSTKEGEKTELELDSNNDPYALVLSDKDKELPHSPELDGAIHKGHELEVSPQPVQQSPYELDASSKPSLNQTSPQSLQSPVSNRTGSNRRQQSDPASLSSVGSLAGHEPDSYFGPISPDLDRSSLFGQALRGAMSNDPTRGRAD